VVRSPTIADWLMTTQEISDADTLSVSGEWFNGCMVEISTKFKDLQLKIDMDAPGRFENILNVARLLTSFKLNRVIWSESNRTEYKRPLYDTCHRAVKRLLQDPNSQLQHLYLNSCDLNDNYLITISDFLPTLRLETLDISDNKIQSHGIMEFARRLPEIKFLTSVSLERNPWLTSANREECGEALLEIMMHNTSIEYLGVSPIPQSRPIEYYCKLNRDRRTILSATTPVPLALWPRILQRGRINMEYEADRIYVLLKQSPIPTLYGDREYDIRQHFRKMFSSLIQPFSPDLRHFINRN